VPRRALLAGLGYALMLAVLSAVMPLAQGAAPDAGGMLREAPMRLLHGTILAWALGSLSQSMALSRVGLGVAWGVTLLLNQASILVEAEAFAPKHLNLNAASIPWILAECLLPALLVSLLMAPETQPTEEGARRTWPGWAGRLSLTGLSYLAFYYVFGALNYLLVTHSYYETPAHGLQVPAPTTVLKVELLRVPLLALAALPIALSLRGPRARRALQCGGVLFLIGGALPLLEATFMPPFLRLASAWEILLQNGLMGVVAALLLGPESPKPVAREAKGSGRWAGLGRSLACGLAVLGLTLYSLFCFVVSSSILAPVVARAQKGTPDPGALMGPLLLVCLLQSWVMTHALRRSCLTGWRLYVAGWLVFYGLSTVVTQVEALAFLSHKLPPGMLGLLFVSGALQATLLCLVAVPVASRLRPSETAEYPAPEPLSAVEWTRRTAMIAAGYVAVYFLFGYYVAWQVPEVRAYYSGSTAMVGFWGTMGLNLRHTPWMLPLQLVRGLLWLGFLLPLVSSLRCTRAQGIFTTSVLAGVWSAVLLIPNFFMPEPVRQAHLVETVSSNLLFGALVGWLVGPGRAPERRSQRIAHGLEPRRVSTTVTSGPSA
jgi:hypothetical protein